MTGAARGVGADTARLLAEEGALVLLGDVLDERGQEVAAGIGERAAYQHLDVTREDDWSAAVREAIRRFGGLDVLVNNAAVLDVSSIAATSLETVTRIVTVNQIGPFLGIRAAIEPMRSAGGGSIVNISSIDGMEGQNGVAAYTSSKWGLRGLSKAAAVELGRHGIRVNTVCPGMGSREMVEPFVKKAIEALKQRKDRLPDRPVHPFARRGTIRDVAQAVAWLASDEAAFVSGTDLVVDGAFTAGKVEPAAPFS